MIRAILRNVQCGLIISASLLVVLAFQRLSLYSVPVLVGNIVHPGQPPSDSAGKELVGHGHAHGQHRIFSTNVIEIGLFKFVVPFRWASAGEEDVEEEAVRGDSAVGRIRNGRSKNTENTGQSANTFRRPRNERARRNRPRNSRQSEESSEDVEDDKSHMLGASPPRLKQKMKPSISKQTRTDKREQKEKEIEKESKVLQGQVRNASEVDESLVLLQLNETLLESNVTALPARRLLKQESEKTPTAWLSGWFSRKGSSQDG